MPIDPGTGALINQLANPPDPMARVQTMYNALTAQKNFQAQQAAANAYQQSVDPNTGAFDQNRFNSLLSQAPGGGWGFGQQMLSSGQGSGAQAEATSANTAATRNQLGLLSGYAQPLLARIENGESVTADDVRAALDNAPGITPQMRAAVETKLGSLPNTPNAVPDMLRGFQFATQASESQASRLYPTVGQNIDLGGYLAQQTSWPDPNDPTKLHYGTNADRIRELTGRDPYGLLVRGAPAPGGGGAPAPGAGPGGGGAVPRAGRAAPAPSGDIMSDTVTVNLSDGTTQPMSRRQALQSIGSEVPGKPGVTVLPPPQGGTWPVASRAGTAQPAAAPPTAGQPPVTVQATPLPPPTGQPTPTPPPGAAPPAIPPGRMRPVTPPAPAAAAAPAAAPVAPGGLTPGGGAQLTAPPVQLASGGWPTGPVGSQPVTLPQTAEASGKAFTAARQNYTDMATRLPRLEQSLATLRANPTLATGTGAQDVNALDNIYQTVMGGKLSPEATTNQAALAEITKNLYSYYRQQPGANRSDLAELDAKLANPSPEVQRDALDDLIARTIGVERMQSAAYLNFQQAHGAANAEMYAPKYSSESAAYINQFDPVGFAFDQMTPQERKAYYTSLPTQAQKDTYENSVKEASRLYNLKIGG